MGKKELIKSLRRNGFSDSILKAFGKVKREAFIDRDLIDVAYEDMALPLEKGSTISQPYTIAFMLELLELKKGIKILEVGSGSGYVLALMGEITGGEIYGIEIIDSLFKKSRKVFKDYKNIKVFNGNGSSGLKGFAPFDRILVSASADKIPKQLIGYETKTFGPTLIQSGSTGLTYGPFSLTPSTTTTCSNECSSGSTKCVGGKIKNCGNYDSDSCREWSIAGECFPGNTCPDGATSCTSCGGSGEPCCSSGTVCSSGLSCSNNICKTSTTNTSGKTDTTRKEIEDCKPYFIKKCSGVRDSYWYDSCGNKQEGTGESCSPKLCIVSTGSCQVEDNGGEFFVNIARGTGPTPAHIKILAYDTGEVLYEASSTPGDRLVGPILIPVLSGKTQRKIRVIASQISNDYKFVGTQIDIILPRTGTIDLGVQWTPTTTSVAGVNVWTCSNIIGFKQCSGNSIEICRESINAGAPSHWSGAGSCSGDEKCVVDRCVNKDCTPSSEICDGIDNNCDQEIDEGTTCPSGQACRSGSCVDTGPSCVNECPPHSGNTCSDDGKYTAYCFDLDNDGCYSKVENRECEFGCEGGKCLSESQKNTTDEGTKTEAEGKNFFEAIGEAISNFFNNLFGG